MKKNKWTIKKWKNWIAKNSMDSYSFVVCLAILILIEAKSETEEECHKILQAEELGLSGAQAGFAIGWYLRNEVEGLPEKEMAEVRKKD